MKFTIYRVKLNKAKRWPGKIISVSSDNIEKKYEVSLYGSEHHK